MGADFPVPRAVLPIVTVTPQERAARKAQMHEMLAQALEDYDYFREVDRCRMDRNRWKEVAQRDAMTVYRERHAGSGSLTYSGRTPTASSLPSSAEQDDDEVDFDPSMAHGVAMSDADIKRRLKSLRSIGEVAGRLEAAIFAVTTLTREDLVLDHVFLHKNVADAELLYTLEAPTPENPRVPFLGYKWTAMKSSGGGLLVKHRDSLYVEYSGITTNKRGEQIGFLLIQAVELPDFPELPERNSVRSWQSVQLLLRQKNDDVLDVFMTSCVDGRGSISPTLSTKFSVDNMFLATKLMEMAELKQLTKMIYTHRHAREQVLAGWRLQRPTTCSVCFRRAKFFSLHSLTGCNVCGRTVCAQCRVPKQIVVYEGLLGHLFRIESCKPCVVAAAYIPVAPSTKAETPGTTQRNLIKPRNLAPAFHTYGSGRPRSSSDTDTRSMAATASMDDDELVPTVPTSARNRLIKMPTQLPPGVPVRRMQSARALQIADRYRSESAWTAREDYDGGYANSAPGGAYIVPRPVGSSRPVGYVSVTEATTGQRDLYSQMLELQRLAEDTYHTTRKNRVYMEQNMRTPTSTQASRPHRQWN